MAIPCLASGIGTVDRAGRRDADHDRDVDVNDLGILATK
jgi:hypothetical protein